MNEYKGKVEYNLPRGLRNNNPGNIRKGVKWKGLAKYQPDPGFATFESMAYGYRAIFCIIRTYILKYNLKTVGGIIGRYAPPNENNTRGYIQRVADGIGGTHATIINWQNKDQMQALVSEISKVENGRLPKAQEVKEGWELFAKDYI